MRFGISAGFGFALLAIVSLLHSPAGASPADKDRDFLEILRNGDRTQRISAVIEIIHSGPVDDDIYELMDDLLIKGLKADVQDEKIFEEVVWLARGLSSSGNTHFDTSLERMTVSSNRYLNIYGKQFMIDLEAYRRWYESIDAIGRTNAGRNSFISFYAAMLRSPHFSIRSAIVEEIVTAKLYHPKILETAADELLAGYQYPSFRNKLQRDSMAMMCKLLANSGEKRYIPVLKKVASNASNIKIKRHAAKAIRRIEQTSDQKDSP